MKKTHRYYLLGAVLLLAFAGFSLSAFKETMTPYVSYQEARAADRVVQVMGALEKGSSKYVDTEDFLYFTIKEPESKDTIRVRYKGLKPANFEDAISIVAIGHFDEGDKEFEANKLLVKCPSKYQGAEVKEYS
ncbi:MAG: cytochrome c-type biosis protein CcmE [Acidobacteriota bacterium]|jgi:cytochrome c-type biogenesis protein CcmE|nr:cytochrome c-type biosis protein CcmE [Acidobacteriota bacterium]